MEAATTAAVMISLGAAPSEGWTEAGHLASMADASVDCLVSESRIERLTRDDAQVYLSECRRVLKKDGVLRITTASLSSLVNDYTKAKLDRNPAWVPESRARMLNEGMRSWGHTFLYDGAELEDALKEAGFTRVEKAKGHGKSRDPRMNGIDRTPDLGQSLIYEARP